MQKENYNPEGYAEYLENEHYHHEDKGCEIVMIAITPTNWKPFIAKKPKGILINKFCKTHRKMCSKTGWELGWYSGEDCRQIYQEEATKTTTCQMCDCEITTKGSYIKYCPECAIKVAREQRRISQKLKRIRLRDKN